MRRDPRAFGIEGSRWTLARIHQVCDWLGSISQPGLCRILERLGISWKRAREHVHSPDPKYLAKLATINLLKSAGGLWRPRLVVLYLDEVTYYRQPTLACAYEERGRHQGLAERSYRSNTSTRVVATLEVLTGRVLYKQASRIGVRELVDFYRQLRAAYSWAQRLYVVQDNWPVHFHPDVLVGLEEQENPWPVALPPSWGTEPSQAARRKWGDWQLPIQLVPLPTYASWANPIEKLWRWLKQEVLHLHRLADDLEGLRAQVRGFLDRFAAGSDQLLRYTGLLPAEASLVPG